MTHKHGVKKLIRARMSAAGETYTDATEAVSIIRERMAECDETFDEAQGWYDDPRNELLCETCGWTVGMVCPECSGCGCNNFTCTGWRHREYMHEDDLAELYACEECGGDTRNHYDCQCT